MNKLDKYNFSTHDGFNSTLLQLRYETLQKFFKGKTCIELGCADGKGTIFLADHFSSVTAVDGSARLLAKARKDNKKHNVTFIHSYFEDLDLNERFDTVILAHILEHVDDPISVLKIAKKLVKKKGNIIIDVPNALSIHRQVGVLMRMIKTEYTLNDADKSIGHQRVYDLTTLKKDINMAGLKVLQTGGVFLKPFSNVQLEKLLDKRAVIAFNEVGMRYPQISAEIYAICSL